ncbi:universal stress protein [Halobium salinum]|uniref:Universal stress protein n=1 Tax=Halobium salinum TaxID=1364940 RepID=A0ABD5PI81_9EURY|nr:universal stress protein [Halobium salinum]
MYDNILLPYDGSDEAKKAAVHGIELAATVGATIHAFYVIDLPGVPRALSLRDDEERLRREYEEFGEEILDEICSIAAEHGVDCETDMRSGTVSDEIVDYAEERGMDAIVIGSAYRGKVGSLLGGTTDKVVRTATVPVISQRMKMEDT